MSIQAALAFIQSAREKQDITLKSQIQALGREADLEDLVQIGAEAGFDFTAEELQAAYKHGWAMRWFRHQAQTDD
jgi:predicted ribosomally synthesized peptide with nif11-like leader